MDTLSILRQYKIGPFAVFDTVTAYVGIFLVAPLLTKLFSKIHINIPRVTWMWLTLPISVLFHLVFRQNTPFMNILLDQNSFYLPAIVLIFMISMGLMKISRAKAQGIFSTSKDSCFIPKLKFGVLAEKSNKYQNIQKSN